MMLGPKKRKSRQRRKITIRLGRVRLLLTGILESLRDHVTKNHMPLARDEQNGDGRERGVGDGDGWGPGLEAIIG